MEKTEKKSPRKQKAISKDLNKICFTGYDIPNKDYFNLLAQSVGMKVVTSVSKSLGYLVCGNEPGESKYEKAVEYGTSILTIDEFYLLLASKQSVIDVGSELIPTVFELGDMLNLPASKIIAIDFETAEQYPDSACSIGLVIAESGIITKEIHRLIRPPRDISMSIYRRVSYNMLIHGLEWKILKEHPIFPVVWDAIYPEIYDADYFVAHNAYFDSRVLDACCKSAGINVPAIPFLDTLTGAKIAFNLESYALDELFLCFSIPLEHHHALDDARVTMKILEKILDAGIPLEKMLISTDRSFDNSIECQSPEVEMMQKRIQSLEEQVDELARTLSMIVNKLKS